MPTRRAKARVKPKRKITRKTTQKSPFREYETVVATLVDKLSNITGLRVVGSGLSNKVKGWSGYRHQIDVTLRDTLKNLLVLIECKYWKKPVSVDLVLTFHSRIRDIKQQEEIETEGFMASPNGYTSPARKYAQAYGIHVNTVKDAQQYALLVRRTLLFIGDEIGLTDQALLKRIRKGKVVQQAKGQ